MPYANAQVRASAWSAQDYQTRFEEVRSEYAELDQKDRESDEYRKGKASLFAEVDSLDFEYRIVRQLENILLPGQRAIPQGAFAAGGLDNEARSAGFMVTHDQEFSNWMQNGTGGNSPTVNLRGSLADQFRSQISESEYRTLVTAQGNLLSGNTDSANLLLPVGQPYLPSVRRQRLFIRDVMNVANTTLSSIPYVRELNPGTTETSASTVAEGGTKPEAVVTFTPDTAPTTVIAVSIPVTTQVMRDAGLVMNYINSRLSYMLALREEREILNGNGIYPDLKGIYQYAGSGLQTQAATSGETAITLGNAIAKIVVKEGYPNAVALNPVDSWAMKIKRAASGAGSFDNGTPFTGAPDTVWGVPVVETNGITAGKGLVGDYYLGATLFDHWAATVRSFEQHSDFAVKNKVLLLAEESVALGCFNPDWFVDTTIS